MKAVIYTRVSSLGDRQNTDRQEIDLKEYAKQNDIEVVKVFSEHISGAKKNEERAVLCECLNYAKTNGIDMILFSELSRLGRNVLNVIEVIKWLSDNAVNAHFQKENLTLLDANGEMQPTTTILISCLGYASSIERENIKFRLASGRKLFIERFGKEKLGRRKGSVKTKETKEIQYKEVIKCLRKGHTVADTVAICKEKGVKCSISTVKRLKAEFVKK